MSWLADIRTVQSLLGHKDLSTTMLYTHALHHEPPRSPLDMREEHAASHAALPPAAEQAGGVPPGPIRE